MPTPTVLAQTPISTNFSITALQIQMTDVYGSTGAYTGTYNIPSNSDIKGVFKVTAPGGTVIYNNTNFSTPDVNGATPVWTLNISLPLNANNTPVNGNYIVQYQSQINDGTHTMYYVTNTVTYNFNYSSPVVSITNTVNCISPNFTAADLTNYTVLGIAPTTLTRVLTLNYPFGSAGAGTPVVTSAATISTGVFYNDTQTTTVSTTLIYPFAVTTPSFSGVPNFTVSDLVTGALETLVDCTFICQIACCIEALEARMSSAGNGVNTVLYQQLQAQFNLVMSYVQLALLAIDCGQSTKVNGYIQSIQTIANCTSGCDCGTDSPSLVVGLGGTSISVAVTSGGAPVVVTSSVIGNVTTYVISLSSTFVNKVNNFYTSSVTSNNGSITVVETTVGSNQNYDLATNLPAVQNETKLKCTIQFAPSVTVAGNVTVTLSSSETVGTTFQEPSIATSYSGIFTFAYQNNAFLVSDFFVGPADNGYRVLASLSDESNGYAFTENSGVISDIRLFGRDNADGAFYFQIVQGSGRALTPVTWANLAGNKYELTFSISE